jgi:membrane-associated protease RseP (regulator of RpoE activity)
MKTQKHSKKVFAAGFFAVAALFMAGQFPVVGAEDRNEELRTLATADTATTVEKEAGRIDIKAFEPVSGDGTVGRKEMTWLGVAVEEALEVVTSQLGLEPGVGLVVAYVTTNSPAAKAGIEKNDVLVELAGQSLVHPAQFRKLIQVRKEGDVVKLVFYRGGKKQSVSAPLGKTNVGFGLLDGERPAPGSFPELPKLQQQLQQTQRELMGRWRVNEKDISDEIRRSMDAARRSYEDAMRQMTNVNLEPVRKALESLKQSKFMLDSNAVFTLRSSGTAAKSIVKADEAGTIVIVANPKLHMTAHDKDGKLLFDGEIETEEQRTKVPADLWKKTQPLIDKVNSGTKGKTETKQPKESTLLENDSSRSDL